MRVHLLKEEYGDQLKQEWRSFLLRPHPDGSRNLEKFKRYTKNWIRISEDEPSGNFREWATDESPPSHSIPPHLVAKAAAELGGEAFDVMHEALLKAYFAENRDISSESTLRSIWDECSLPRDDFERWTNPAHMKATIDEHNEALNCGANGAPAFRLVHINAAIVGAQPVPVLSRWIKRAIDGEI